MNPKLSFNSERQEVLFRSVLKELGQLGYSGELLQEHYQFSDWFSHGNPQRNTPAAAFGQHPFSYESACFAVLLSNGKCGPDLVSDYRSLGAPMALEIRDDSVVPWRVSLHTRPEDQYPALRVDAIARAFRDQAPSWSPQAILRAKNIAKPDPRQLDFIDLGLIPALEENVRRKLDPLLREAIFAAQETYNTSAGRQPEPRDLFKLAFWLLTGKVLYDRQVEGFKSATPSMGPDEVLSKVARHYNEPLPSLLNKATRQAVHQRIWTTLDFRNLSFDVLAHVWSATLVTDELRKELGIHRTPRTIAKYIVDRIPFEEMDPDKRVVVEPCCGSSAFAVEALQRLRRLFPLGTSGRDRHQYFTRMLSGFDTDPFALEISRLCLTLADFPNPNGWKLREEDVFASERFLSAVTQARVVLCNPPFEDFPEAVRHGYQLRSFHKPGELLHRVLDQLPPEGVLGFIVPSRLIDGQGYREVRQQLTQRFDEVEILSVPDNVFDTSQPDTAILTAIHPRLQTGSVSLTVIHGKVEKADWERFSTSHKPTHADSDQKTLAAAVKSLSVPELGDVWTQLAGLDRLGDIAEIHRGIEWNKPLREDGKETGNREKLVLSEFRTGYREGLPPLAESLFTFHRPDTRFLSVKPEDQRGNALSHPWDNPKVFLNAKRKSRGRWRIAAFADFEKLVCYQTFTAVWPKDRSLTVAIAAILNSPIANAWVATRQVKRDITSEMLRQIPVPAFSKSQIHEIEQLVAQYRRTTTAQDYGKADHLLRQIDASVLEAYDLPAELERALLDWFRGERRIVPFEFRDYFPEHFEHSISLREFLRIKYEWDEMNNRRVDLISKEVYGRLSSEESLELESLQSAADARSSLVAPLPIRELEQLKEELMSRKVAAAVQ